MFVKVSTACLCDLGMVRGHRASRTPLNTENLGGSFCSDIKSGFAAAFIF